MESVVATAMADSRIREWAAHIVKNTRDNDISGQIDAVVRYVMQNMTYVRDPEGEEFLISPINLYLKFQESGSMMGDCDDHVMLLNALLGSIGFKTICLGVKLNSNDYNHVISGVVHNGVLYQIDPCAKDGTLRHYDKFITAYDFEN